jgi:tetratricopeptide (TPR) repeat protein
VASPVSLRIAVLPFLDMSAEGIQDHFSDGFADAILNALAAIPGLDVVDRQSSFQPSVVSSGPTENGSLPPMGGGSQSLDALDLYFRGLKEANSGDQLGLEGAIEYFGAELETDPDFALAYAGLADAYLDLESDAPALVMTAIRLRPSCAPAGMWLGNNLLVRGRTAEGLLEFQKAGRLDPLSAKIAVGLLDQPSNALATLAAVHAKAGNGRDARDILEKLKSQVGTGSILPTALVYANLAEKDSAFALLHRVPSWTAPKRDWLRNSPVWDPIRGDPRWGEFLSFLGMG